MVFGYLFIFVALLHGCIHILGFLKAFKLGNISQLTLPISKKVGLVWLTSCFLFFISALLFLLGYAHLFKIVAVVATILSQGLIINGWEDAKYGTLANIVILILLALI